jgi:hypothetical protein
VRGASAATSNSAGWLALLLIRVVENATGETWRNTRHELDRMRLVTLVTLATPDLPAPLRFFDFTVPTTG